VFYFSKVGRILQGVKRAPAVRKPQNSKAPGSASTGVAADRTSVAAVIRATEVLLAFRPGESSLTLALLAERTGMYKSTILRLLQTLEGRSFVARLADGSYRLGPALLHLGTIYQKSFRLEDIVNPQLAALAEATGESASFFVSDGTSRVCLFRSESKQQVRHTVEIGEPLPMGRGASGTVLATFIAGADVVTANAFARLPSVFIGSNPLDISAIAGPVFGVGGEFIGAVSISGPATRFDAAARRHASNALIDALQALTSRLGGDPGVFAECRAESETSLNAGSAAGRRRCLPMPEKKIRR
jgi:DNA-binding IclR family transcriptional regulator